MRGERRELAAVRRPGIDRSNEHQLVQGDSGIGCQFRDPHGHTAAMGVADDDPTPGVLRLHEGDQVTIIVPEDNPDAQWAAVEAPL